ncbi:SPOR domain-containing protein [Sphingomonas montanisoli]|uniref:Tetratricopeptide repeat protein n=1 Tax=Sphingomonas montanisoli TaxID=2606412 RepID=A0A5D9C8M8_9SPHN|nr:SPOR domain-containing protein [Sphingomonas montanisoli]TZG27723.1 tetratricopeptide repeat protein [Sphingomonas montanisoli]
MIHRLLLAPSLLIALSATAQAQEAGPYISADQSASEPVMVDPMAQARDAMARNDPAEALARYLRVLARDPGDLEALTGAGDAALAVGDADAAINFYVRAEKLAPKNGKVKAGLGSALVQKEQPQAALRMFNDALDLGVPPASVALDRGLAYDLRGDAKRAQTEYGIALRAGQNAEATRRMALSLGIAGDKAGALAILDPLLRRQDIPAWRVRAFVLAMTGDTPGAEQAAYAVLPRYQADQLRPFLGRLATLKPAEKAAAVHFGHFPEDKAPRMASVSPPASAKGAPVVATPVPSRAFVPARTAEANVTPGVGVVTAPIVDPTTGKAVSIEKPQTPTEAQSMAGEAKRLADAKRAEARKAAAEKAAADKKKKEKEEAKAKASDPGRFWVQIASGSYKPDLDKEWDKQKKAHSKQLAGKTPWTMPYKSTNRLLVGPFASKDAAQDFVNDARQAGWGTVPVTTSAGQKVERLD